MSSFWIWLKADTLPSLKWLKHFVTAIGYLSDRAIFLQRSKVHIERDNVWLLLQYKANIIHLFTTTNLGACWWGSPDRDVAQDQVIRDVDILSKSNDEKKTYSPGGRHSSVDSFCAYRPAFLVQISSTPYLYVFFKIGHPRSLFHLIFVLSILTKMSIQYTVLGFKPATFGTRVSSHNH